MTKRYNIPTTIELNDAEFDELEDEIKDAINVYLMNNYDIWNMLNDEIKQNVIEQILDDFLHNRLNK